MVCVPIKIVTRLQNKSFFISYRKSMKIPKIRIWGLGGLGAIFTVNFKKRIAQKLRRIILLHFGLPTFGCHSGKTQKPFIFMIFGFWDMFMTPKTNLLNFGDTKVLQERQEKTQIPFRNIFWKISDLGNRTCWKRRAPENPGDSSLDSCNSWIWYQYLQENMNWDICHFN